MRRGCTPLFAFLCAITFLGGCDKQPPSAPDGDPSFTANPGDPTNLTATAASATQIDLGWQDMSPRETGFEIQRATGSAGAFTTLATTDSNVSSFSDAGLTAATEYCYKVRSFRTTGRKKTYSGFSNTACATTQPVPPPPPGPTAPSELDVRLYEGSIHLVRLSWKDNSTDEEGFRIERGTSDQGPWNVVTSLQFPNATSYIDFNSAVEQPLCYRVIAFKGQTQSASNVDCTLRPAAPTNLTTTAVSAQAVDLRWTDNSLHEEGFDVQRSEAEDGVFTSVGTTGIDVTTFRDATVSADKTYWYRVWVMREGVRTGSTNTVKAITISAPPLAPSALSATPLGSTDISVFWTDNSANEEAFRVERSENGGVSWVAAATTMNRVFFDGGRTSDQQVCYRAIAFNALGDSPPSNVDCTAPPRAPTNLVATTAPGLAIELTWTDNSGVEDGYAVQRLFDNCGGYYYYCAPQYLTLATLGPNATSYRDAGLSPGQWHSYHVVAIKDDGYSDGSNEAGAWSDIFLAPSNLTATAVSSTRIDLAWSDNSDDEENFYIERCTGVACSSFSGLAWASGFNATTFSDVTAQPNTTYSYRVWSYRYDRYSGPSNPASATTPP